MKVKLASSVLFVFLCVGIFLTLRWTDTGCRYRWVPIEDAPGWSVEQYRVDNPFWCRK